MFLRLIRKELKEENEKIKTLLIEGKASLFMRKKTHSPMWKHFGYPEVDGKLYADRVACSECYCIYSMKSKSTTGPLNHWKHKHNDVKAPVEGNPKSRVGGALVQFICEDLRPIRSCLLTTQ